jgi:hypothetical protein
MKRFAVAYARSFALASALAGCSLAFGIDKDDYARAPIGSVPEPDAADAGASAEAANPDGDSSPPSPCKATHFFCDDFDDPNVSLSDRGWLPPFLTNGSTMVVDELDSKSPRRSLSVRATPNGFCSMAREVLPASAPTDITLAFDIHVEDPGIGVALADIILSAYHARFYVSSVGVATVDEWDDTIRLSTLRASSTAITGRWAHVELTLHFVANKQPGSRIMLRVDDSTVVDDTATPSVPTAGGLSFDLGDIDHPDSTVRVRFDNVTLDTK